MKALRITKIIIGILDIKMPKTGLHWFRHGLRLHDNPALNECQDECERFVPIFIFDGSSAGLEIVGYNRFRFLIQSLKDLERQFSSFGINFFCFYGKPEEVLEKLIKEWDVKVISFEKDSEAIWKKRDDSVKELCKKYNVQVIERISHTLYDPEELFILNNDEPPNTCEELRKSCLKLGEPEQPVPSADFNFIASNLISNKNLYDQKIHKVPDLDDLGIKPECPEQEVCIFQGGETRALELFKRRLENEIESFKRGVLNPNLSKPIIFTKEISLSPYLRYGCLSVRKFYWDVKKAYLKYFNGDKSKYCPAEQLFWREYFYQLSYKNINFSKVIGNPMSFQIVWDCMVDEKACEAKFSKWEKGITGFPWIDACMRQLIQEGWIHHVCRNSLAIFLTRGDLFISWEKGMNSFFKYLIDADWSVNAGNWNWISCGDPEEILKKESNFCPIKHSKKLDPNGIYIRKYVKELRDFPTEYIFEPWKAPLDVQEKANCIIGKDYPEPMVDHDEVYRENQEKLVRYFNLEKREIFETFLNDKYVLKPANLEEFQNFIYTLYLES